jgi:CheY-like chemotaxis protein
MRVLVVEDEPKLAHVLESVLQAEHYDVVRASTGEEGELVEHVALAGGMNRMRVCGRMQWGGVYGVVTVRTHRGPVCVE